MISVDFVLPSNRKLQVVDYASASEQSKLADHSHPDDLRDYSFDDFLQNTTNQVAFMLTVDKPESGILSHFWYLHLFRRFSQI